MPSYKDTLNLPKTDFPMRANLAVREPKLLRSWEDNNLYATIRAHCAGREKFILHDGPPYANGALHVGHAVNKVLKDITVKSKTLSGYDAPFVPGWDCHGLPIEHKVESKVGKAGEKITPKDFRAKCRQYANTQVEKQMQDFVRMGVLADWAHPYLTMRYKTEADTVRALGHIVAAGHVEQGFKPVYWSVVGASALAEAEVEYRPKTSTAVDVRYRPQNEEAFLRAFQEVSGVGPVAVVIWTTTPWTLPASQAVSVGAELEYVLVNADFGQGLERLVIALSLLEQTLERYGVEAYKIVGHCQGHALELQLLVHPFYAREVPILLGDHVTTEAGTGQVHTAPDHGIEDFDVARRYGIKTLNLIDDHGVFGEQAGMFSGAHVYKVDDKIVAILKDSGALVRMARFEHSYPHCWRTKTPLIYRATPQWFIRMDKKKLRERATLAIQGVRWYPAWGQRRIETMLTQSPDWCISRQRTWGVPITLFIHKKTAQLHSKMPQLFEKIAQLIEKEGIDAWYDLDAKDLLGEAARDYKKVTDTLDVWFDSGVTHFSVLEQSDVLRAPADLYLEGSDQHRGWFLSSLKTSVAMTDRAPYRQVLTHGFVVDQQGRKMSKSLGNVIWPQTIMNKYGADILRLWIAASDYTGELAVSDEILARTADAYRRMRNTGRFLLANTHDFNPAEDRIVFADMLELDCWIVDRAWSLQKEIKSAYERYQFQEVYQKIHRFCSVELGAFYLDVVKDRQYTTATQSLARRSCQTAMFHVLEAFVRWIAPILSFTAAEMWDFMPARVLPHVHMELWYRGLKPLGRENISYQSWNQLLEVRQAVNKALEELRNSGALGSALEAQVVLYCDEPLLALLQPFAAELHYLLITSSAKIARPSATTKTLATEIPGLSLLIEKVGAVKCQRCWHYRDDVGHDQNHADICPRCVRNIEGPGEVRRIA